MLDSSYVSGYEAMAKLNTMNETIASVAIPFAIPWKYY